MRLRARTVLAVIALSTGLAGCDRLGIYPEHKWNRYQLMKDARGQTLRLDTVTGDIVAVDSATIPRERSSARPVSSPAASPEPAAALAPEKAAEPAIGTGDAKPVEAAPVIEARTEPPAAVSDGPNACAQIEDTHGELMVSSPADAFVDPGKPGVPIASLTPGTTVRALGVQGDWLLVRFQDRVWGDRAAYIRCTAVQNHADGAGRGRPTN